MLHLTSGWIVFLNCLFIFRERGREGEREGEKHWSAASCTPPTGDLACKPGMCPAWELSQRPLGSQAGTQSTEPHQPGLNLEAPFSLSHFKDFINDSSLMTEESLMLPYYFPQQIQTLMTWFFFFIFFVFTFYIGVTYIQYICKVCITLSIQLNAVHTYTPM